MKVCSQCLRTLRKQARVEQLAQAQTHTSPLQSRYLSTASPLRQRSQRLTQTPAPEDQAAAPPMPTTAPTVTTNVTAQVEPQQQPQKGSSKPKLNPRSPPTDPSTSQMQRHISANMRPQSITHKLATTLRSAAKSTTESYITYGLTEILFKSCAARAPYTIPEDQRMGVYTGRGPPKNARQEDVGVPDDSVPGGKGAQSWWFNEIGLEPTFSVWSQVCFLHMYILTVKLRTLENEKVFLDYQRYLIEHFSNAAEDKMALLHGMNARGVRNKFLKDLFQQWRGVLYAYDEGLVKGDAVLAGAVWRNLWKADEDVDWEKVAVVVGYMRRCIAGLNDVDVQEITSGLKEGSNYWEEAQQGLQEIVGSNSRGISEPM
ncbi:Serine carboxypeptidase 3 [Exophiala xenobiotica]|uniref:Serine carboxypeptidase 3 n=1 Tax=Lithohypha guttulata TaxID=1690604 RepID=A0ABR0JX94_9EURO|nr:Serine carboxypeptidase 3 [Lithohypha guttulata]KAK5310224.1 Serine carboxypeptidase 3 [Exophiala xenobiotica]